MKYDIYFHNDFDGHASAAVMLAFLRSRGDEIEHYVPLRYDVIPQWIDEKFFEKHAFFRGKRNPAIVVDFPYHPAAAFWFDHHLRPFRKEGWEKKFKPDRVRRFEDSYRSACHLAYDSLREGFGWKPPARLRELVKWLDIIDFANYKSARQTIAMKEPALQINVFIEHMPKTPASSAETIRLLSEYSLEDFIKTPHVKKRISELRRQVAASIRFHKKNIKTDGRVMVIDLTGDETDDLAYFAPYYLYPRLLYAVRFHPFPGRKLFHVNVGVSPWRRSENKKNIGGLLKKYGGGGHKDVGGVEIGTRAETLQAVNEITDFLNKK